MKTLRPDKLRIKVKLIKQTIDKNIIDKVCKELYHSSIKYSDLINFVSINKN